MDNQDIVINGETYSLLYTEEQIREKVLEIAKKIIDNYTGKEIPTLLIVLNGGMYFGVMLSQYLDDLHFEHYIDTICIKSYSEDRQQDGVTITKYPDTKPGARPIIVAEDIIDTGDTLNYAQQYFQDCGLDINDVTYAVLLMRDNHGALTFTPDYVGFMISGGWVVGCGLDTKKKMRGSRHLYIKEC